MSDETSGSAPTRVLPDAPSLEWLRKHAKQRLMLLRQENPSARLAEAQSALDQIEVIRTTLAEVANIDDFLEDLDAAKRTLLLYLLT